MLFRIRKIKKHWCHDYLIGRKIKPLDFSLSLWHFYAKREFLASQYFLLDSEYSIFIGQYLFVISASTVVFDPSYPPPKEYPLHITVRVPPTHHDQTIPSMSRPDSQSGYPHHVTARLTPWLSPPRHGPTHGLAIPTTSRLDSRCDYPPHTATQLSPPHFGPSSLSTQKGEQKSTTF